MAGKSAKSSSGGSCTTPFLLGLCLILACTSIYKQTGTSLLVPQVTPQQPALDCVTKATATPTNATVPFEAVSFAATKKEGDAPQTKNIDEYDEDTEQSYRAARASYKPDPLFQAEYDRIDNEDPAEKCKRYGLQYDANQKPRRLFFGTMMADESWDVFAMHAVESYGVYSKMALVESNTTHMANPRNMRFYYGSEFRKNMLSGMFGPETDIAIDYFLDEEKKAIWMDRDSLQRELIRERWVQQGMTKDDVGIMSDVDEIWSRDFLRAAQICIMPKFSHDDQSCKMPKVVSACIQFEASPHCIKRKPWFHPDMISGHCIDRKSVV